ncbi:hypothetical protein SM021_002358 [Cronobacter muytjensii]|nr:hypothetical protein [Cronobacter muytjensii]
MEVNKKTLADIFGVSVRAFPQMPDNQLERLRKEIAKASNRAAGVGECLPELAAEYIATYQA